MRRYALESQISEFLHGICELRSTFGAYAEPVEAGVYNNSIIHSDIRSLCFAIEQRSRVKIVYSDDKVRLLCQRDDTSYRHLCRYRICVHQVLRTRFSKCLGFIKRTAQITGASVFRLKAGKFGALVRLYHRPDFLAVFFGFAAIFLQIVLHIVKVEKYCGGIDFIYLHFSALSR